MQLQHLWIASVFAACRGIELAPKRFANTLRGVTHYQLSGDADDPLIVLSPGLGASMDHFDFVTGHLVERGFQVLRYDFYDRGLSQSAAEYETDGFKHDLAFTKEVYVDQITSLLESLGLGDKRFTWVGHSTGGAVGLALAAIAPGKIAGIVLMSSAGLPVTKPLAARVADVPIVGDWLTRRLGHRTYRSFVRKACAGMPDIEDNVISQVDKLLRQNPKYFASIRSTNRYFPFGSFREPFEDLCSRGVPVQLIWGTRDSATPYRNCERFERIAVKRGAPVEKLVVPGGSHSIHQMEEHQPSIRESILRLAQSVDTVAMKPSVAAE